MKSNLLLPLIFILLIITVLSCKKKSNSIVDYRDQYIGDYNFTVNEQVWFSTSNDSIISDTVKYYSGQITKSGAASDEINICFLPKICLPCLISQDGAFTKPVGQPLGVGYQGKFESISKVSFEYGIDGIHPLVRFITGNKI